MIPPTAVRPSSTFTAQNNMAASSDVTIEVNESLYDFLNLTGIKTLKAQSLEGVVSGWSVAPANSSGASIWTRPMVWDPMTGLRSDPITAKLIDAGSHVGRLGRVATHRGLHGYDLEARIYDAEDQTVPGWQTVRIAVTSGDRSCVTGKMAYMTPVQGLAVRDPNTASVTFVGSDQQRLTFSLGSRASFLDQMANQGLYTGVLGYHHPSLPTGMTDGRTQLSNGAKYWRQIPQNEL